MYSDHILHLRIIINGQKLIIVTAIAVMQAELYTILSQTSFYFAD